jgi:alpha-L-arabinofuranosidase
MPFPRMRPLLQVAALVLATVPTIAAPPPLRITVDGAAARTAVSPSLYGIFFEEINHAGEGGLYAEMVLNRDFEITTLPRGAKWAGNLLRTANDWQERKWFGNELWGWKLLATGGAQGSLKLVDTAPLHPNNPHSMRVTIRTPGARAGVVNSGHWGMNVQRGRWYDLTFFARTETGTVLEVTATLESASGRETFGSATVTQVGGDWKQYRCSVQATDTDPAARLALTVNRAGTLWLDVVSLFPRDTYKGRANGLRADLVQTLADLQPAFVRFPGGAIVGGMNLDNRIQWKHSIGPIEQRRGTANLWGYWTGNGLGFHEYLQLCEDLGADALWVCNPGFSDNYRHAEYCAPEEVKDFVQEALDGIEYAIGPTNSTWGAQRAANGHPTPFPLRYIEIGNEASTAVYRTNYAQFYDAIHARYPDLTIICNQRLTNAPVPMVDDHKYGTPEEFFRDFNRYDTASRSGPAIYVGEYGCTRRVGEGNLMAALAEAAYLLGLERNGDIVRMASYAPLFFHVNDIAWPVNLIGFDNSRVAPRSSYYVQKLLAHHRPDEVLSTTIAPAPSGLPELFAVAGVQRASGEVLLRVVNRSGTAQTAQVTLSGLPAVAPQARVITLSHADPTTENTVDEPDAVLPVESTLANVSSDFSCTFAPYSFTLIQFAPAKR